MVDENGEFRRQHARKEYCNDVVFSVGSKTYAGCLKNISVGGAFVLFEAPGLLSPGDVIHLRIPFTRQKKLVKRRGKVMWTSAEGFALSFF